MKHYESISEYNDVLYNSSPVSVNDYLSDKYNVVHNELYNDALEKYLKSLLSKYVNNRLLYEIFKMMNQYNNRNTMVDDMYDNTDGYIYQMLKEYEIKKYALYELVESIDDFILNLKEYLLDNAKIKNINEQISDIISMTIYNIYDFRLYVENKVLLISENDNFLLKSEIDIDSFFFLFEEEDEAIINIGFNSDGEILIIVNDGYDYDNIDNKEIIKYALKKQNKSLMESVLNIFMKYYKKYHRIIELKNVEYWMPSEIIVINNKMPHNKVKIDLKPYWNFYQKHDEYDISYIKIQKENNLTDSEVVNIDYVNGKTTMHARTDDIKYNVPFKYMNENALLGDEVSLKNTFMINL